MKRIFPNKTEWTEWTEDGKLHRIGKPAIEYKSGVKSYYIHGEQHREDGPALIYPNGFNLYYIHGILLTKEEFDMYIFVESL